LARAYRARLLSPSPSPKRAPSSSPAAARSVAPAVDDASDLPPVAGKNDARVANLMKRFDGVNSDEVREALDSVNGHAGRAATKLRAILDRAARSPRGRVEHPVATSTQPEARAAAAPASSSGTSGRQDWSAVPSPRSAVQLTTGKPLALQRVGTDDEAMVLVRKVRTLCDCGHGAIQEVVSRSGQRYALKVTDREGRHWTDAVRETKVMADLNGHPLLVKLIAARKDTNQIYALVELCTGGDLCARLAEVERLDEEATKFYGAQLSQALQFMHTPRRHSREGCPPIHYIHRDIKPDNVFIAENGYVKLGDFGFTAALQDGERRHTKCGTYEYMAPEVVRHGGYGRSADYWSLGVMLYECIHGATPFAGCDDDSVYKKILQFKSEADLNWSQSTVSSTPAAESDDEATANLARVESEGGRASAQARGSDSSNARRAATPTTASCRDFIARLMTVEIEGRLGMGARGAAELAEHKWLSRGLDWARLNAQELPPPWIPPEVHNIVQRF
jgi:serine/threonine protein kinase